ncbi:DUF397 domain-containing protein [Streptomyces sp. cg28]|uniref:DUF397 domain-containing protein n=1 Tax=Streptomyces sp. cg28 TaxID=3403457 RepID=UPI003B218CA5
MRIRVATRYSGGRRCVPPSPSAGGTPASSSAIGGGGEALGETWTWRKSSASTEPGQACVEIAWTGAAVLVRDSVRPEGDVIAFPAPAWRAFLAPLTDSPASP